MKYIELNAFLKVAHVCSSGGQAKQLITNNEVKVNGEIETRIRRKLIAGDVVEYSGNKFDVLEDVCLMEKN